MEGSVVRRYFARAQSLAAHPRARLAAAVVVAIVAIAIRAYKLDFGLPYTRHPDEAHNIRHALRIVAARDLNPHFFRYPSLIFYVNALGELVYFWFAKLFGKLSAFSDIQPPYEYIWGVGIATSLAPFVIGRLLSLAFSSGTALLGFSMARRLGGLRAGFLAGLAIALSPINVANARYVTPDAMTTFFVTLALFWALGLFERGRVLEYCLAGAAAGLAAGSKYNGGIVAIAVVAAHFARPSAFKGIWKLCLAGATSALAFLASTPYMVLDSATFKRDLNIAKVRYSDVHSALLLDSQDSLSFYLSYLYRMESVFVLLAGAFVLQAVVRRSRAHLFFSVFPVAYLAFIGHYTVHNDRTLLPVVPALWVMAAVAFFVLLDWALRFAKHRVVYGAIIAAALVAVLYVVGDETMSSINFARIISRRDVVDDAREWLDKNLPPGARVAIEPHGPFVDMRFRVKGIPSMSAHPPGWYRAHFDYVVLSSHFLYYADPIRNRKHIRSYEALKRSFPPIKVFTGEAGATVEVLRTN